MSNKDERLSLRATRDQKQVFEAAAKRVNQTVTSFVLQSAWDNAQRILADQQEFPLPPEVWDAFTAALDGPPVEAPRLREFLKTPSVLEA
jgi:uncharacterized protein (DUF1778 family)